MSEGANRVLIDLPLRLQKAQAEVFRLEDELYLAHSVLSIVRELVLDREIRYNGDDARLIDDLAALLEGTFDD